MRVTTGTGNKTESLKGHGGVTWAVTQEDRITKACDGAHLPETRRICEPVLRLGHVSCVPFLWDRVRCLFGFAWLSERKWPRLAT